MPDGSLTDTYTILTTESNEVMRPIHDRMPVILDREEFDGWLDPDSEVKPLMDSYPADQMYAVPISTKINSPRNEGAEAVRITDT